MSETLLLPVVAYMTRKARAARVERLVSQSREMVASAIAEHITSQDRTVAGICLLFSGGNDSTTLAHMFRDVATHAVHANTTIGIEQTRQFVRDTCAAWDLPLIEKTPPRIGDHYRSLVLDQGFPGPGQHNKMFQRLKERGLRAARAELVKDPRRERVVFLAGIRRAESARRAKRSDVDRDGSTVWVSPLINWTTADMTTYRRMAGDVPTNEVSDLIHMSGECLCGAFAHEGERAELDYWFRSELGLIRELEGELQRPEYDHIPTYRKTWGWGGVPELSTQASKRDRTPRVAGLCETCADRFLPGLEVIA